ncbi:MAG: transcriptional regulator [Vicinamibacterales bacterium]
MRIGHSDFDSATGEVRRDGRTVRIEPQPAAVLTLLAARPGELVSHDELRRAVWGDATHVNFQQSLHYCVRQLRRALGDTDRSTPIIESIPRRGYRLLAAVEPPAREADRAQAATHGSSAIRSGGVGPLVLPGRPRRWAAWVAVAAATVVVVSYVERRPNDHHRVAVAVLQAVHDLVY